MNTKIMNKILIGISLLGLLVIIFPSTYRWFGRIARWVFVAIMYSRPIRDLLPKYKILNKIVSVRKGLGVVCGNFALAHGIGYFIFIESSIFDIFTSLDYWNPTSMLGAGILATLFIIPPLITSNNISIKILKRNWKIVQQLSYPAFILTGVHIYLVRHEPLALVVITIYIIIFILAFRKQKGKLATK
ncbi:MAG: ferric reductase-like transmembrane domain-containing protein [Candidatus Absconditabacteria bacterium]